MSSILRLREAAKICAATHDPADIVEHLEEECIELLMAIKRWKRGKGPLRDIIEEANDVNSETHTFFELLEQYGLAQKSEIEDIRSEKLDKYEAMLDAESDKFSMINRYKHYLTVFLDAIKNKLN